jgi:hypothetical protein
MNVPIPARPDRRSPFPRPRHCVGAVVSLALFGGAAALADTTPPFRMQTSVQARFATQTGGGFALRARLTPARTRVEGNGYAVDAVATPAGTCSAGDVIFRNGFDQSPPAPPSSG